MGDLDDARRALDAADLDRLAELHAKATPGPWVDEDTSIVNREYGEEYGETGDSLPWDVGEVYDDCNREYLIAMHNALPELLRLARIGLRTEAAPVITLEKFSVAAEDVNQPLSEYGALHGKRVRIVEVE